MLIPHQWRRYTGKDVRGKGWEVVGEEKSRERALEKGRETEMRKRMASISWVRCSSLRQNNNGIDPNSTLPKRDRVLMEERRCDLN